MSCYQLNNPNEGSCRKPQRRSSSSRKNKKQNPKKEEKEAQLTQAEAIQKKVQEERKLKAMKEGEKGYQEKRKEMNERLAKQTDINELFRTNCSWIERVEHLK